MTRQKIVLMLVLCIAAALVAGPAFPGAEMVRARDMTFHGAPLSPGTGSANVLVGGQPAWRANLDVHCCPMVLPPGVPHGCGVAAPGSNTVLVNGYPAVYVGCSVFEPVGGMDAIITGCPTVLCGP